VGWLAPSISTEGRCNEAISPSPFAHRTRAPNASNSKLELPRFGGHLIVSWAHRKGSWMGRPSKYPAEFRQEAVRLALVTEESRAAVARRLGINETTLRNWVADHLAEEARGSDPLAIAVSEREGCVSCARRMRSCGPSARSCARQPPISPRRRSGLPLPVRRRVPRRLRRQAALWSPWSLAFRVLCVGGPAGVGPGDPRRRVDSR
jgi:transposase-like protein